MTSGSPSSTCCASTAQTPINGVIVGISISDVIGHTEEQLEQTAKTLRTRIDEVMTSPPDGGPRSTSSSRRSTHRGLSRRSRT